MLDLDFKLKPSKQYMGLMLATLCASEIIVLSLSLVWWIKGIAMVGLCAYGGQIIWRYGLLKSPFSIIHIRRHSNGLWRLYTINQTYEAALKGDSVATGFVSILRFRVSKRFWPVSFVIFPDSLDDDHYRRLLVILRMG